MLFPSFRVLLGVTILALSVDLVTASPLSRRVVHERRDTTPHGWSLHRRADPDIRIPLSFALVQSNVHNLDAYLHDVAHPSSPNYGKHWSPNRIAESFRPAEETVDTVRALLQAEGVNPARVRLSKDGGYIRVEMSVAEAEAVLATEYYVYGHEDGATHVACGDAYHLPEHIVKHVDAVWPTIQFSASKKAVQRKHNESMNKPSQPSLPRRDLTPVCLASSLKPRVALMCATAI